MLTIALGDYPSDYAGGPSDVNPEFNKDAARFAKSIELQSGLTAYKIEPINSITISEFAEKFL